MADDRLKACLNIMRRLPPSRAEANLSGLVNLVPDLDDDLMARVDQPFKVRRDGETGQPYLECDFNRDGDSFRSPWSNRYEPPIEDDDGGVLPPAELRTMEVEANEVFGAYRELYYGAEAVSSVYFWKFNDSCAAAWLVKKEIPKGGRYVDGGCWDSISVIEVQPRPDGKALYKVTSSLMLTLRVTNDDVGEVDLSGNLTRQDHKEMEVGGHNSHVTNMGQLVESMETALRGSLNELYISKAASEVVWATRSFSADQKGADGGAAFVADLSAGIAAHAAKIQRNIAQDAGGGAGGE